LLKRLLLVFVDAARIPLDCHAQVCVDPLTDVVASVEDRSTYLKDVIVKAKDVLGRFHTIFPKAAAIEDIGGLADAFHAVQESAKDYK
jgi:hypothetical protein